VSRTISLLSIRELNNLDVSLYHIYTCPNPWLVVGQEPIRVVVVVGQNQVLTVLGPACCLVNMLVFAGYQVQLNMKLFLLRY